MIFEERENSGEFICDIFDPEDRFVGRVWVGNFADWKIVVRSQLIVIIKQYKMYCIQQKDNGYGELVVYRMK